MNTTSKRFYGEFSFAYVFILLLFSGKSQPHCSYKEKSTKYVFPTCCLFKNQKAEDNETIAVRIIFSISYIRVF